jgi:predicted phosphodiesterase
MEDPLKQSAQSQSSFIPFLPVLVVVVIAISRRLYGRRMPRAAREPGETFQFAGANFRKFDHVRRKEWIGAPVDISITNAEYSFAIFGDVTGAEFPFTSRRGGYFVYRDLVKIIQKQKVNFAISVGDLATQAGAAAYRRLRQILRHLYVPLTVSPGNHDLFAEDEYQPQYFHSLFGADNSAFTIGHVRFVLLNNAWGSIDESQFKWLEDVLSAQPALFTFIFCHKPVIDPRANDFYAMEDRRHAARLCEIFQTHKVTAVFSGHIHTLLKHEQDGVAYIISGGGGSKPDGSKIVFHYLLADVKNDQVRIRALPIQTKKVDSDPAPLMELTFTASA